MITPIINDRVATIIKNAVIILQLFSAGTSQAIGVESNEAYIERLTKTRRGTHAVLATSGKAVCTHESFQKFLSNCYRHSSTKQNMELTDDNAPSFFAPKVYSTSTNTSDIVFNLLIGL
jgi:hypothetical protein